MTRLVKNHSNFLTWVFLPSLLLVVSVFGVQFISRPVTGQAAAPECSGTDATPCNTIDPNPCRQFQCVNSFCEPAGIDLSQPGCGACGTCGNGICDATAEIQTCGGAGQDCNGFAVSPLNGLGCPPTAFPNGCSGATHDFCCPGTCSGDPATTIFDIHCACCGDSLPGTGELCDPSGSTCTVPGGLTGGGTCNTQCQCITNCGDGNIDPGEQCDPPNGTTCDANCQTIPAVCGNGIVEGTEQRE